MTRPQVQDIFPTQRSHQTHIGNASIQPNGWLDTNENQISADAGSMSHHLEQSIVQHTKSIITPTNAISWRESVEGEKKTYRHRCFVAQCVAASSGTSSCKQFAHCVSANNNALYKLCFGNKLGAHGANEFGGGIDDIRETGQIRSKLIFILSSTLVWCVGYSDWVGGSSVCSKDLWVKHSITIITISEPICKWDSFVEFGQISMDRIFSVLVYHIDWVNEFRFRRGIMDTWVNSSKL